MVGPGNPSLAALKRSASTGAGAASGDRFAAWPPGLARIALGLAAVLLIIAALVPITAEDQIPAAAPAATATSAATSKGGADVDFYSRVVSRIAAGEAYYDFIVAEQRAAGYPVRPGLTARLPTLAYVQAVLGPLGTQLAALALLAAALAAWWRRLGSDPVAASHRTAACALAFAGSVLALNPAYLPVHELWAGLLITLALALYTPPAPPGPRAVANWLPALAAVALAVAIREHALPCALLLAATAWHGRSYLEAGAWILLVLAFVFALAGHLQLIDAQALPGDAASPSWLTWRGPSGALSAIALSSGLHLAPHWLSGMLVVLALIGWAGWRSPTGALGLLLFGGYALGLCIVGRPSNFYWGLIVAPGLLIGLAFAPSAAKGLFRAAFPR